MKPKVHYSSIEVSEKIKKLVEERIGGCLVYYFETDEQGFLTGMIFLEWAKEIIPEGEKPYMINLRRVFSYSNLMENALTPEIFAKEFLDKYEEML